MTLALVAAPHHSGLQDLHLPFRQSPVDYYPLVLHPLTVAAETDRSLVVSFPHFAQHLTASVRPALPVHLVRSVHSALPAPTLSLIHI